MTPVFCCGFECGVTSAHWTLGGGTAATFTTSSPISGLRSLSCSCTAGTSSATTTGTYGAGLLVIRFKISFSVLPSANTKIFCDSTSALGVWFKQSDSKLYAGTSSVNFGATGVSVTTGTTYFIDLRIDRTGNPNLVDVQVNGIACGQASGAIAADTTARSIIAGISNTATATCLIDDVIVSATTGDYPIGDGKVLSFVPNADGTHTFTTTIGVRGTTVAPTGGGNIAGSTDSFGWLNARPIGGGATDATRLWNQQTNGATLYGEVLFEDTTEVNAPRAVEALVIQLDAGTGVGDSTFKLNDNGTESTIFATGAVAGIASDTFHTKQFATAPSTSAAWTLALFNGLRFRFGYSADANPDHYCRGVMIEAEFPTSLDASAVGLPDGQLGQNQMQQLLAQ